MGGWAGFGSLPVSSFCPEEVCCYSTSPPYKSVHYGPHTENGYVRKVAAGELTKVGVHLLTRLPRSHNVQPLIDSYKANSRGLRAASRTRIDESAIYSFLGFPGGTLTPLLNLQADRSFTYKRNWPKTGHSHPPQHGRARGPPPASTPVPLTS